VLLLLMGGLIIRAEGSVLAPFIYTPIRAIVRPRLNVAGP
jgi:hypothetical protein